MAGWHVAWLFWHPNGRSSTCFDSTTVLLELAIVHISIQIKPEVLRIFVNVFESSPLTSCFHILGLFERRHQLVHSTQTLKE
jgi:hypothetical protein